ncbi:NUDIX hydrolase [Pedobacter antarcticus]|uniref:DNA mismatch repair protein MutT n=2 Tax=Pedobacter antarcticus TaxID=34086 RepID=A0A081PK03_9SPHI|nr:NUDIX hydrolase [Pedobacter antarcticus]KEQ31026.1 DNA mismatch repair protein MutT [Pedobacter antarcticus 4BY]SDM00465.1 ADP-ribose pyrophosphatase YjhB, NUDIX family [Pedobacter antarcticus]SFF31635.1 ADP-ribose pyrophosphatase YjhB, NUDIX family [Pedobacter antarcticus]
MTDATNKKRILVAIDCIIFGFDGEHLKILLIKRGFAPEQDKWSLMGGFINPDEGMDEAANKILLQLTGLDGVYLEQLHAFGRPDRDPMERVVSVAYFALIDIHKYETQLSDQYHAEWFLINEMPKLIFDHDEMVEIAKQKIRYKAALHPLLFELLPRKFTIPQLQSLYEGVYNTKIDNRNFIRKLTSTGLLIKLEEKDKSNSKKGAFYFKLDKKKYKAKFQAFLNFIPNPENLIS